MDWKDIGKSVATLAPTISTALLGTGPVGMIAGGAIKVLTSFFGMADDAKPEDVVAKINALTPDKYVELQQADMAFKQHLADAGVKLEEIAAGDRDSARKMQVALRSATPDILAFMLTVGFFGMLWFMYTKAPPSESKDLLNIMLGALGAAWTTAMAFYFGSSTGSDKLKDILSAGGR